MSDSYEIPEQLKISQVPCCQCHINQVVAEIADFERKKQLYQQLRAELFSNQTSGQRRLTVMRDGRPCWTILIVLEGDLLLFVMPWTYVERPDDEQKYDPDTSFVLNRSGRILIQPEHIDQMITRLVAEEHIYPHQPLHQQAIRHLLNDFTVYFDLAWSFSPCEEWHWRTFMAGIGDVCVESIS